MVENGEHFRDSPCAYVACKEHTEVEEGSRGCVSGSERLVKGGGPRRERVWRVWRERPHVRDPTGERS